MTSEPAPKYRIPNTEFINIEYPGKVQNHERAFENLGGLQLLEKVKKKTTNHPPLSGITLKTVLLTLALHSTAIQQQGARN
jgi:hypothetical protein